MATFDEIMSAAAKADAAGNTADAKALVDMARSMMPSQTKQPQPTGPIVPPAAPQDAQAGYMTPPTGQQPNVAGDVTKEMAAPGMQAAGRFWDGLTRQGPSPTLQAMPQDWNPALKNIYATVGDAGGAALSAAGGLIAGGAGAIGEMVGSNPTQERKLANDLLMMSEVAVPELAGVSSTNIVAGKAARAAEKAARSPSQRQAAARAAGDLGITPSLGMTGKTGAMVAAGMEKIPGAGAAIAKDATRAVGEVEGAFNKIKTGIGRSMSPTSAGGALQEGLSNYVTRFKDRAAQMFDKIPIDGKTRVAIPNTTAKVADLKQAFEGNPELAQKLGVNSWDSVISEAGKNGVSWDALKSFRTSVGDAIGAARGSLKDEEIGRLNQLYGSLTEDMAAAVGQAGPDAEKAWRSANSFYKNGADRIARSLDHTISAKNPERAFEAFNNILKADRSSTDLQRMRQIKASLKPSEWNDISASIVDRLGKVSAGQQSAEGDAFSAAKFLTEWNKIDPQAKRILFQQNTLDELNKLAKVADMAKAAGSERNFSNTALAANMAGIMAGFHYAPGTTAATLGSSYVSAKAMTSPLFLKAVNKAARGDVKPLEALAKGSPFAQDARTILRLSATQAANPANNDTMPNSAAMR